MTPVSQGQLPETRPGQRPGCRPGVQPASHRADPVSMSQNGWQKRALEKAAVAQYQDVEFLCPILLSLLRSYELHIGDTSN